MMSHNSKNKPNGTLVKFIAPRPLKRALQDLAAERNIALSALLRLIATDYVKRNKPT